MSKLKRKKIEDKGTKEIRNTKKSRKLQKEYTVDKEKVDIKLGDNKILASDPYIKDDTVLTTFFGEDGITTPPNQIDVFLQNTILLAEKEDDVLPWIPHISKIDSFIMKAIEESNTVTQFKDSIKDSEIVEIG